jgi:hypothetical protein
VKPSFVFLPNVLPRPKFNEPKLLSVKEINAARTVCAAVETSGLIPNS